MIVKFLQKHKFYLPKDQVNLHMISEGSEIDLPNEVACKFIKKGICSEVSKSKKIEKPVVDPIENKMDENAVEEKKSEAPKRKRGRKPAAK